MKISNLHDKNILIVVAHQDDEALFAGGLMTKLKDKANLHVVCMSKPKIGRKDTFTREEAFKNVCKELNAKHYLTEFTDFGQYLDEYDDKKSVAEKEEGIKQQMPKMVKFLKKIILDEDINVMISHSEHGEYLPHFYHQVVNQSCNKVLEYFTKLCFLTFAVGHKNENKNKKFTIRYSVKKKKKLLSFYEPHWSTNGLKFAYKPEKFIIEKGLEDE